MRRDRLRRIIIGSDKKVVSSPEVVGRPSRILRVYRGRRLNDHRVVGGEQSLEKLNIARNAVLRPQPSGLVEDVVP